MASVAEIATELHRLVKAGLAKPQSMDPQVYIAALSSFSADVLQEAITNFLAGLYREHSTVFYPSAPQLADYCRRVQQAHYEAGYAERFNQRVRESRAAQAALEKLRAQNSTPEARARIDALMKRVPLGERREAQKVDTRIRSGMVRDLYGMTPERLAEVPDAGTSSRSQ